MASLTLTSVCALDGCRHAIVGTFQQTCADTLVNYPEMCTATWYLLVNAPVPLGCLCPVTCKLTPNDVRRTCPCEADLMPSALFFPIALAVRCVATV